jgi:hypothetical protein
MLIPFNRDIRPSSRTDGPERDINPPNLNGGNTANFSVMPYVQFILPVFFQLLTKYLLAPLSEQLAQILAT